MEGENIQVLLRLQPSLRPVHEDEVAVTLDQYNPNSVLVSETRSSNAHPTSGGSSTSAAVSGIPALSRFYPMATPARSMKQYSFDHVAGPTSTQFELFQKVGMPITERCLSGYNGTIFAYGQTGSGKTYTMQGPQVLTDDNWDERGLIPRILEYLFDRISQIEAEVIRFL
jgi:hypothetical protein